MRRGHWLMFWTSKIYLASLAACLPTQQHEASHWALAFSLGTGDHIAILTGDRLTNRNEAQSLFIFPAETPSNASAPAANANTNTAGSKTVYDNRPTRQCLERSHQSQLTYYCVYIYSTSTKNIIVWLHTWCFAQASQYRQWAEMKNNYHTSKVNVTSTSQINTPSLRNFNGTLNKQRWLNVATPSQTSAFSKW